MGAEYKVFERRRKLFAVLQLLLLFPALLFAMVGYGTPWWFQMHLKVQVKGETTDMPNDVSVRLFQFSLAAAPTGNETACPGTKTVADHGFDALLTAIQKAGLPNGNLVEASIFPLSLQAFVPLSEEDTGTWISKLETGIPYTLGDSNFLLGGTFRNFADMSNQPDMPIVEVDGGVGLFEICYTMDKETLNRLMGVPMRTKLCSSLTDMCDMIQANFSLVDWLSGKLGHPLPPGATVHFDGREACGLMHKSVTLGSLMVLCQLLGIFGISCLLFAQPTMLRFIFVSLFLLLAIAFACSSASEFVFAMMTVRDGVAEGFDDVTSKNADFPEVEGHGKIGYSAVLVAVAAALQIISLLLLIISYCLTKGGYAKSGATYSKMGGVGVQNTEIWRNDSQAGQHTATKANVKRRAAPGELLDSESDGLGDEAIWARDKGEE